MIRVDNNINKNLDYINGDYTAARLAQLSIMPFVNVMFTGTFPSALKAALNELGRNAGEVRKPLMHMNENERNELLIALKEVMHYERVHHHRA